jgi:hypothetical protein
MSSFKNISKLIIAVLAILVLTVGSASARTLTVGTVSGTVATDVLIPITIDDPTGVGGVAFTITYDPALFTFVTLEQAPTSGWTIKDPDKDSPTGFKVPAGTVLNNVAYYNPYKKEAPYADRTYTLSANATLFYQFNDVGAPGSPVGRVLVSGASAVPLTGTVLFRAKFTIKSGVNGTMYPIGIQRSIINYPAAGYTADTMIPALVGVGDLVGGMYTTLNFPVIPATLVAGGIMVNAPVFNLGGKVTYGAVAGGANAVGCTVVLKKESPASSGIYVFNSETTVSAAGLYAFTGKPAGSYKISVTSLDPNYDNYESSAIPLSANKTDANVELVLKPTPVRLSGTVTSGNIPGLMVKVVNGETLNSPLMGIYGISGGTWSSALLPAGGNYHYYLIYGSLASAIDTPTFDTSVLKTISGTITGLPAGGGAVTASSVKGKITKTVQVPKNDVGGKTAYTITDLVAVGSNFVPANDYIVSAVATGFPLTYYNGKTDVNEATPVDISSVNATDINFTFVPPLSYITGAITDSGQGVVGTTVYGFEVNTFSLISTTTGSGGAYSLSVPKGKYEVFVIKNNGKIFYFYNTDGTPTQNQSGAVLREITADAQTVANTNINVTECDKTLSGKVTYKWATGDPAANVLISVFNLTKQASGLTGQDGRYTVSGLCNLEPYTVEMKPVTGNYPVQTTSIVAGTNTTKNFIIDTGAILSGTVTYLDPVLGTTAVAGAMIYLKDQATGSLVGGRIYFSAAEGTYSIHDIQSGEYTLEVTHPDYLGYTVNLVIGADMTQDVALEKGAYFKGTITEYNSNPVKNLAGATVIVTRVGAPSIYAVTNSAGFYSVYGLDSAQDYIVMAQVRDYERQAMGLPPPLRPTTGGTVVDFALAKPTNYFTVSGTVKTNAASSPEISGAIVLVSSAAKNFFASTTTDTGGLYFVANLIASTDYKIVVIPPGLPTQESTFAVGPNATKDFTIPVNKDIGGTITGNTAIPPTTKVYVYLYKVEGVVDVYQGFQVAGTGGSFQFKGLADGNYKVSAEATGYTPGWYNSGATIILVASVYDANIQLMIK